MDKRIAYYTRKVAEYGSTHKQANRNKYRHNRLLAYKSEMHRRIGR